MGDNNKTYSYTFEKTGPYYYFCERHQAAGAEGIVYVAENSSEIPSGRRLVFEGGPAPEEEIGSSSLKEEEEKNETPALPLILASVGVFAGGLLYLNRQRKNGNDTARE